MNDDEILAWAPLAVFALVAGADGQVDARELASLASDMAEELEDTLLQQGVAGLMAQGAEAAIQRALRRPNVESLGILAGCGQALSRRLHGDAATEKRALMNLAKRVAHSSGSIPGAPGYMSIEESGVLVEVARALDIDVVDPDTV